MNTIRFRISLVGLTLMFSLARISSAAAADGDGFKPLFNGKDLSGWYIFINQQEKNKDPHRLVQIQNGEIHLYKDAEAGSAQPFGYIATENTFSNYHLRLQYRWAEKKFAPRNRPTTKRDSGLLYHFVGDDKVWPRCVECQIQEGDTGDFFALQTRITGFVDPNSTKTNPIVRTNAAGEVRTNLNLQPKFTAEGGVPFDKSTRVVRNPMNEVDGWNTVEVIIRGDTAEHIVNGKVNNRCTNIREMVGTEWAPLKAGRIALQLEGAEVLFRNIEIKELKE